MDNVCRTAQSGLESSFNGPKMRQEHTLHSLQSSHRPQICDWAVGFGIFPSSMCTEQEGGQDAEPNR